MVNGVFSIPLSPGSPPEGDLRLAGAPARTDAPPSEFIAGPENRLAGVAVRAMLEATPTDYYPLVLYGPSGSGKSHLARGLAEGWRQAHPNSKVVCLPASEFAEQYAAAVTNGAEAWRAEIRNADLLVLDDLGQLAGKRGAQQELVRTLDARQQSSAAVVVTARSLPNQMTSLAPRLRSRLSAGLIVPLALPGPAARHVLIERLAAARGLKLPRKAAQSLANGLNVPAPGLLAAIMELERSAHAGGSQIDLELVRGYVNGFGPGEPLTLRVIATVTAKQFGLKLAELKSPLRRQAIVSARGVAIFLARELTDKSLEEIGKYFGGRDHTTVLHGYRRTEKLVKRDPATRHAVAELRKTLLPTA